VKRGAGEVPEPPHGGGKQPKASEQFLFGFTSAITQDLLRNPAERKENSKSFLFEDFARESFISVRTFLLVT